MRILTRYVLRQLLAPFLFAAILLTALMMLDVVADRFGSLVGKGLGWRIVSEVFLYSIPFIFAVIVPMAVLVAVLFVFNRLAADNEISAMKASGVSLGRITLPVVALATLLAAGLVHFNNTTLPESNHKLALLLHSIARKSPTFAVRDREVNEIVEGVFLVAQSKEQARNLLIDVTIWDVQSSQAQRTIYADSAVMGLATNGEQEDLFLTLFDGVLHETSSQAPDRLQRVWFDRNYLRVAGVGNELDRSQGGARGDRELSIDSMQVRVAKNEIAAEETRAKSHATAVAWTEALLGNLAEADTVPPDTTDAVVQGWRTGRRFPSPQSAAGNFRTLSLSETQFEQSANRYEVEIWKKYSIPVACIVFVIIGAPIAVRYRRAGVALVVGVSLVVFCAYYVALIGGEHLADRELLSPFWAMFAPNFLFGLIGVMAFFQARRAGG
ncbi:MAG: LptF/LptG family permease [marine benthic group bacterium]|nr:LptF/LptG family permease [Gemmatimonadota bacterium]MCL7981300.1 LptF/LptG family permease [Gemmatimonadota bacterium]MCL7991391.1 LptF/LptG family permease [Gemmatimonadota bacterium]